MGTCLTGEITSGALGVGVCLPKVATTVVAVAERAECGPLVVQVPLPWVWTGSPMGAAPGGALLDTGEFWDPEGFWVVWGSALTALPRAAEGVCRSLRGAVAKIPNTPQPQPQPQSNVSSSDSSSNVDGSNNGLGVGDGNTSSTVSVLPVLPVWLESGGGPVSAPLGWPLGFPWQGGQLVGAPLAARSTDTGLVYLGAPGTGVRGAPPPVVVLCVVPGCALDPPVARVTVMGLGVIPGGVAAPQAATPLGILFGGGATWASAALGANFGTGLDPGAQSVLLARECTNAWGATLSRGRPEESIMGLETVSGATAGLRCTGPCVDTDATTITIVDVVATVAAAAVGTASLQLGANYSVVDLGLGVPSPVPVWGPGWASLPGPVVLTAWVGGATPRRVWGLAAPSSLTQWTVTALKQETAEAMVLRDLGAVVGFCTAAAQDLDGMLNLGARFTSRGQGGSNNNNNNNNNEGEVEVGAVAAERPYGPWVWGGVQRPTGF